MASGLDKTGFGLPQGLQTSQRPRVLRVVSKPFACTRRPTRQRRARRHPYESRANIGPQCNIMSHISRAHALEYMSFPESLRDRAEAVMDDVGVVFSGNLVSDVTAAADALGPTRQRTRC